MEWERMIRKVREKDFEEDQLATSMLPFVVIWEAIRERKEKGKKEQKKASVNAH